ncbi:MAG: cryptochrome/photolyase family protein [Longimicrobiales bacterium]|nr:cryptochrome/photolyase family protein [Longimicrobiales bacterium]
MGSAFLERLEDRAVDEAGRRWLFVPYDQLTDGIGPLAEEDPDALGIVVVESPWKAARRPYHKQKLALVLANLRHFALEQAERGVAVRHIVSPGPYRDALRGVVAEVGPVRVMEPAERELRVDLRPLVEEGAVEVVPHEGWLTTEAQFEASQDGPPWRMDAFYRRVRQDTGILMEDGSPAGGKYSFDPENREFWDGDPPAPEPPTFPSDPVKDEVMALVEDRFGHHPGRLRTDRIPATRDDAEALWQWALDECMPHFGPYEDAMSEASRGLFHTRISPLLNLHRLLPADVVEDVAGLDVALASREGFIRQVLGWREFVRHVHQATDGFRELPGLEPTVRERPGDGGFGRWHGRGWIAVVERADEAEPPDSGRDGEGPRVADGGAAPAHLDADRPLPVAYWGTTSGLRCLDTVVDEVWDEGWSHHITRLMVLSNIALLLDADPRELTDWFWAAYTDAYDWVVEPNVLGMGTFAAGDLMTTKPYVSGANYINRMSDYCGGCRFDPEDDCPLTRLYWAFLARHEDRLDGLRRMALPLASLRKRADDDRQQDRAVFEWVRETLEAGEALEPDDRSG